MPTTARTPRRYRPTTIPRRRRRPRAAPRYEPPVVTPLGNLNDLLAYVCPPHS